MTQGNSKNRVLIVGSDAALLITRRDVLRVNGIASETELIASLPHALAIAPEVSLIVACSSLNADARQVVFNTAHSHQPKLPCLVIAPSFEASANVGADAVLGAFEGPERFVKSIQALISV